MYKVQMCTYTGPGLITLTESFLGHNCILKDISRQRLNRPNNYFSLLALCSRKETDPNWRNSKKIQTVRLMEKVKTPASEVNFMAELFVVDHFCNKAGTPASNP